MIVSGVQYILLLIVIGVRVIVSGVIILVSIKMTVWTRSMHIYRFHAELVRNCCEAVLIFLQCRQAF